MQQLVGEHAVAGDHDEPVAAPARRRLRVVGAVGLVAVVVLAAPGLAAVAPGGDHPRGDRRRAPARLAEAQLVEARETVEADVDPDEVLQLERAHAEAGAQPADAVDLLDGRDALAEQPQRLQPERPVAAVHEEARAVGGEDHALAHRLAGRARRRHAPRGRSPRRRSPRAGA